MIASRALRWQLVAACLVTCGIFSIARAQPAKSQPACTQSLWGCPARGSDGEIGGPPAQRYERLLTAARSSAGTMRLYMGGDLDAAARHLIEAVQLMPDAPEAYSLLGQIYLERGQLELATPALRRAEELLSPVGPLERIDPQLGIALALVSALEGDLAGALERNLRLLRLGAASSRLLYRTGDVLMALGRLDEATAQFERGCNVARAHDTPSLDVARACYGYLVALDRGEHIRAAQTLRKARLLDRDMKSLRYNDFLSSFEREYHLALSQISSCDRLTALRRYLQGAEPATGSSAPLSYIRRAKAHEKEIAQLNCPTF